MMNAATCRLLQWPKVVATATTRRITSHATLPSSLILSSSSFTRQETRSFSSLMSAPSSALSWSDCHPGTAFSGFQHPHHLPSHHPCQLLQVRWKHSERQLRLKIINHPVLYRRRRREERQAQLLQLLEDDDDDDDKAVETNEHSHPNDVEKSDDDHTHDGGGDHHVPVLVGTIARFQRATIRAKPRYTPWFTPEFLPNGWSAPPPASLEVSSSSSSLLDLPFSIRRTSQKPNQAIGFLPVYSCLKRNDGTKATTRIKKVQGNVPEFVRELQAVLYQHQVQQQRERKQQQRVQEEQQQQQQEKQQVEQEEKEDDASSTPPHPLLLQLPPPLVRIPPIRIRAQGEVVEVDGNHVRTIKTWLAGLGF